MASKPKHERRVFWLALLGGFPAVALALGLLWFGDFTPRTQWTLTLLVAGVWLACAAIVKEHVVRPLQTVSNVLAALRERDYTLRARGSNPEDALGLLLLELNSLGDDLRAQRLGALEATALLRRVMEEIFRQGGLPHQLLVLTDVSRALSDEERQAWKRLIRVLSHELNNSLAPIKSIADSLLALITREPAPPDQREDLRKGLGVIASRSESLSRLMAAYAHLARLPPPRLESVAIQDWVRRVVALETRRPVALRPGPNVTIQADSGQLDQLLINLVRNAVDATLEANGAVEVGWETRNGQLDVWVRDEGGGLADTANLFVPFYTTKPEGSGIGLALSRQIAEAHGGTLTLSNRPAQRGCEARLSLRLQ
ncbi:MAG: PAS domain-containing sensor histidine kinase [Gemmatimonadetes bacterium]|nr:MAG: PAS domain-containing sensor histidine kinase [Gemmatimonadota bacterium]